MAEAAKTAQNNRSGPTKSADGDVLHFLTRTLQAHVLDGEPHEVLDKLQNLKLALDQQEKTLRDWPESPSKTRLCDALARARKIVAQTVDELDSAPAPAGRDPLRQRKAL